MNSNNSFNSSLLIHLLGIEIHIHSAKFANNNKNDKFPQNFLMVKNPFINAIGRIIEEPTTRILQQTTSRPIPSWVPIPPLNLPLIYHIYPSHSHRMYRRPRRQCVQPPSLLKTRAAT
jgi:hypothetical protein